MIQPSIAHTLLNDAPCISALRHPLLTTLPFAYPYCFCSLRPRLSFTWVLSLPTPATLYPPFPLFPAVVWSFFPRPPSLQTSIIKLVRDPLCHFELQTHRGAVFEYWTSLSGPHQPRRKVRNVEGALFIFRVLLDCGRCYIVSLGNQHRLSICCGWPRSSQMAIEVVSNLLLG